MIYAKNYSAVTPIYLAPYFTEVLNFGTTPITPHPSAKANYAEDDE
jgi:hypothetical protein